MPTAVLTRAATPPFAAATLHIRITDADSPRFEVPPQFFVGDSIILRAQLLGGQKKNDCICTAPQHTGRDAWGVAELLARRPALRARHHQQWPATRTSCVCSVQSMPVSGCRRLAAAVLHGSLPPPTAQLPLPPLPYMG